MVFIFDNNYSTIPDPSLTIDILNNTVPMLIMGTPARRHNQTAWAAGDEFMLTVSRPPSLNDVFAFNSLITSIKNEKVPLTWELSQNYPNPFNPATTIRFSIPERSSVKIEVFNILGQKLRLLVNEELDKGMHERQFSAPGLSSGVYIYRLTAGKTTISRKMVLIR